METTIQIYDNKGKSHDRYTVIISEPDGVNIYGMSINPLDANGFNQYTGIDIDSLDMKTVGNEITFYSLPKDVKRAIANQLIGE